MLDFSAHALPYASQRSPVHARRGMVATSQPQAAQVGLEILRRGGNAIDAAIATAAALTVVEPTGCGIGGDAFALVWTRGRLHGLDASGRAPGLLDRERVRAAGHERMPLYGWTPVTVPGCPAAWGELSRRFGKLPFEQLLRPAIELARDGFPVSPVIARLWQSGLDKFRAALPQRPELRAWFDEFLIDGRAPRAGEVFRQPGQADTLDELARSQCESFYRGELARAIVGHAERSGDCLRAEDLAGYQAKWVEPISLNYRGYDVWEIPPSGQGLIALMTLNILKGFEFGERDCAPDLASPTGGDEAGVRRRAALHQPAAVDAGLGRGTAARGLRRQPPCADRRARARSQPRPAEAGRHGVPGLWRRGGQPGLVHPEQLPRLRLRRGGARHRHRLAEPRRRVQP